MKKALSIILCLSIMLILLPNKMSVFASNASILTQEQTSISSGIITEPGENKVGVIIRPDAKREGKVLTIADKTVVTVTGSKNDLNNEKNSATNKTYLWYAITYTNGGKTYSGYVREDMITVTKYTIDKTFEEQLSDFPQSYHEALMILHAQYPNWAFQADKINITFDEAIALESVYPRKLIMDKNAISWASMGDGWYNWSTGVFATADANLKGASREVIAYYMDPRNFLNPNDIFIFMKQSYDAASQNIEGVRKIISGYKLFENYNDPNDTAYGGDFAAVIMEAGKQSGVSPYILASTIIQEQGSEGNALAKGYNYNGTVVYNFFNVSASGNSGQIIQNGAKYAFEKGWTTRSAAIIGGAKFYGDSYLNRGNTYTPANPYYNQDTYFYRNYNILDPSKIYYQYAQNVADSLSSAKNLKSLYTTDYTTPLVFRIPVYANGSLPQESTILPEKSTKLNNYYFNKIEVNGLTPTFSRYTYDYTLSVNQDTNIYVEVPDTAYYFSKNTYDLIDGENSLTITVLSESGYTTNYTLKITATKMCKLTIIDNRSHIEHEYTHSCDEECNICRYKRIITHTYLGNCDSNCEICGFERDNIEEHSYYGNCDNFCNICGFFRQASAHVYDNACDSECNGCGVIRSISHTYSGNCDEICDICFATRVTSNGHTYSNNCDDVCNICSNIRTVNHLYSGICDETCNICNNERDVVYSHIYSNSCDASCNLCGNTRTVSGHNYTLNNNHTCSECKFSKTPSVPILLNKSFDTVTLTNYIGFEYSKDGVTWQDSNIFAGLTPETNYVFCQRIKASDIALASDISLPLYVQTKAKVPSAVTSTDFAVSTNTISKITAGTTAKELLNGLTGGEFCKVYKNGQEISGDAVIGTGTLVKIMDVDTVKAEYTVIVTGDINGDGAITITDMLAVKSHILGKSTLSGVYEAAADTSGDSMVSITDFIQVKANILGKGEIVAR